MEPINGEQIRARLAQSKAYSLVLLKQRGKRGEPGAGAIVREHPARGFPGSTL